MKHDFTNYTPDRNVNLLLNWLYEELHMCPYAEPVVIYISVAQDYSWW